FWTWDTEEVLALIEWMRRYNADPNNRHKRKLHFYGYDMQYPPVAIAELVAYARRVDPKWAVRLDARSGLLRNQLIYEPYMALKPDQRRALYDTIVQAKAQLVANRQRYAQITGTRAWTYAHLHAAILGQALDVIRGDQVDYQVRDRAMADNLRWLLDTQPEGTKIVSWAHNSHVSHTSSGQVRPMGFFLREALGDDHVNFGFAFNEGSFQARDWTQGYENPGHLAAHTMGPAPAGNVGAELARVGFPIFVLDLRGPPRGVVATWLGSSHPMRVVGSVFTNSQHMTSDTVLTEHFDGLIFVDRMTRARPNPKIERGTR
ncbi:MAG: erythromycin esterase family protein, partial [Myxococcota bacterium]